MLLIDALDKIAEDYIPDGVHPYLHVHSRTAWVETVMDYVEHIGQKPDKKTLQYLANSWELLLIKKYSALN